MDNQSRVFEVIAWICIAGIIVVPLLVGIAVGSIMSQQ